MTDKLERIERAKAAMLPLVNEHMDPALRDAWLTDLATAALASSSVPEQGKETALALDTLCNIHNYAFDKELPADTIIGAIRLVVSSALGELTPPPPAPQDRGASQEDGR